MAIYNRNVKHFVKKCLKMAENYVVSVQTMYNVLLHETLSGQPSPKANIILNTALKGNIILPPNRFYERRADLYDFLPTVYDFGAQKYFVLKVLPL